jgi:hypothetical protein
MLSHERCFMNPTNHTSISLTRAQYYNAVADYKALEALVEYLELQRKFYSFGAKYLHEILPSLYEFKRHANEARDKRESIRLMRERQSLQPGAQFRGVKVFGVPLTQVCLQDNLPYPALVEQAVLYLEQQGLDEEGIFRRSPTLPELMTLRANCEEGNLDFSHVTDPHLVSALLKMFLRELPEPLIPCSLYDNVVAVNSTHSLFPNLGMANYRYQMWSVSTPKSNSCNRS